MFELLYLIIILYGYAAASCRYLELSRQYFLFLSKFEFISPARYSFRLIWIDETTDDIDSRQWDLAFKMKRAASAHNSAL